MTPSVEALEAAEARNHETVRKSAFFPGFDGLRAIAALMVLTTHVWLASSYHNRRLMPYLAQLDIGVPVFFVISGFLLYRPFVVARFDDRKSPASGSFWWRRALRIFPAYWVCLIIVSAFMYRGPLPIDSVKAFFTHFFLLQIYTHDRVIHGPVQQSWTLAVEVAFYVFLPFYAWGIRRVATRARNPLAVELGGIAVLYAVSVLYRVVLLGADLTSSQFGHYRLLLPGFLDQLALGMGLAVVSAWLAGRPEAWHAPKRFGAMCWIGAAVCYWIVSKGLDLPLYPTEPRTDAQFMLEQLVRGCFAVLLVAPAVFASRKPGGVHRFLSTRTMVWLGLVSYGVYLWHEAWIDTYLRWRNLEFGTASIVKLGAFVLVTTVVTAAVSYYVIERPALRLKNRPPWLRRGPTVAVAAAGAGAAGGVAAPASPPSSVPVPARVESARAGPAVAEPARAGPAVVGPAVVESAVVESAPDPGRDPDTVGEHSPEARRGFFARWGRFEWTLLVIVLVGFALRLAYIWFERRPHFAKYGVVGDAGFYTWGANLLAEGKGFINPFQFYERGLHIQDASHPVLYILWLTIPALVGLKSTTAHLLWTLPIGTATIACAGYAAKDMWNKRVGLIAAALVAVYPNVWSHDGFLTSETMSIFTATLSVWMGYRYWRAPSMKRALALGLAIGLAVSARNEMMLLVPLILVPLLLGTRDTSWAVRWKRLIAGGLVVGALYAPWVIYNSTRFDHPVVGSTGFGITLKSANCDITYYGRDIGYWSMGCTIPIDEKYGGLYKMDQTYADAKYRSEAIQYIKEHKKRFLYVTLVRWQRYVGLWDLTHNFDQVHKDILPEGREPWVAWSSVFMWFAIMPLAVAGAFILHRRRVPIYIALAPIIVTFVTITLTFHQNRYRASAETAFCMLAAVTIDALWSQRSRSSRDAHV